MADQVGRPMGQLPSCPGFTASEENVTRDSLLTPDIIPFLQSEAVRLGSSGHSRALVPALDSVLESILNSQTATGDLIWPDTFSDFFMPPIIHRRSDGQHF
jgi:hypothetical protein